MIYTMTVDSLGTKRAIKTATMKAVKKIVTDFP
jgi:hypothetical protein